MDQSPAAAAVRLVVNKRALIRAVTTGDTETVVDLLDRGVPIDTKDDEGKSLLHWAALGGHVTTMRLFIRRGCDVDSVDGRGLTPLHWAAAMGQTKAVRELIRMRATKSVVARNCSTPLHQAALFGHAETVEAMLVEGCAIDVVDSNGATVLHSAAQGGHVEVIKVLVDRGCDVNAVSANGYTPLHSAAGCGRTEAVGELIRLDATKSVVAGNCGTPLHQAALFGHVETVEAMLVEGCPINVVDSNGATVLHFAADGGHVEVIKVLVDRGCDVNAVKANGCTPLHDAAGCGRTEAVGELIRLGATKSVVAGNCGTPLHQAALFGHVETVEAMLAQGCAIDVVDSYGETVLHSAAYGGHVEVFKVLVGRGCDVNAVKGGAITDRDTYSVSTLEHCFVGGHASKLSQFCEACGIGSSGEGLRGTLATLIASGLIDAHKVLCLCAISGDSIFLEDQFSELVASEACAMPAAMKSAKYYFREGVTFLNQLGIPDESALYTLHMSLLSMKCFEMGFAVGGIRNSTNDHTSFITKLLSHPVLKRTVNEYFPNGLSPLDLARQFELPDIASLIEGAGGRPGVWADIPHEIEVKQPLALARLKEDFVSMMAIAWEGEHGHEFLKRVFTSVLHQPLCDCPSLLSAEQLGKENVLRQKPKSSKLCHLIIPHVSSQNWKLVGLLLMEDIADSEETLNAFSHEFSDDRNRFLETLSYWLEHGSSVTWKTLLDVLSHFETKHTIDELTDKIVSELGGAHQVSVQCCVLSEGAVWCAVWRKQVLLSCHVSLCLF